MVKTGDLLLVITLEDRWTPAIEWAAWLMLRNWIVPRVAREGLPSEVR